jgi:hypothetical protein
MGGRDPDARQAVTANVFASPVNFSVPSLHGMVWD